MKSVLNTQFDQSTVCVVDGDPAVRDGLAYLCQSSGYDVAGFATSFAFLNALDQVVTRCVICEAQLPDGSGLRLYQELRRRGNLAPFALMLSRSDGAEKHQAERLGIQFVWAKPITERSALVAFLDGQT